MDRVCRRCGAREHWQPVHGGIAELCEECVEDAVEWKARGTYLTDVMDESGHGVVGSTLVLA
jgi:ribosomal protein L40E